MNGVVRFSLLLLLLCLAASVVLEAAPMRARPGSFLTYCVTSPEDLAAQARSNPLVAARYGRHFGMPPEMVSDYFRHNLKLTTLKKARVLPVYFVSAGGAIKSRMRVLPAGTPVFSLPDGQLVLEAACGNPISKALHRPPVVVKPSPVVQVISPSASVMPEPVAVAVLPPPAPIEQFLAQPVIPAPPTPLLRYAAPLLGGLFITHTSPPPPDEVIPELPAPVLSGIGGMLLIAGGRLGRRLRRRSS